MAKTKIICTIGPVSNSEEVLEKLILNGMNIARLNFSHGSMEQHGRTIDTIRRIARNLDKPVGILQDLPGPKIRIGAVREKNILLRSGSGFILTRRSVPGDSTSVSVQFDSLPDILQPGDIVLLNDGTVELKVLSIDGDDIKCRVVVSGFISSHKGINLPTRSLNVPSMTAKDRESLRFGISKHVDYVAMSFVRSAIDIQEVKTILRASDDEIPVIAKIEKHEALANFDDILDHADGIMIARGDLGVETPLENIPRIQKQLIHRTNMAGKPCITATQMMRSMVDNPRPTRAEVSDVANAVLDGTDAIMLSEETAMGRYPVDAVKTMAKVAEDAEKGLTGDMFPVIRTPLQNKPPSEAICQAACLLAESVNAKAIIVCTQSGSTARLVAKYRPVMPIIALTPSEITCRQMTLIWGVIPLQTRIINNETDIVACAAETAIKSNMLNHGDTVVITAGLPLPETGKTNMIRLETLH
ncbi:pyruvate kinase [bacterium]|nr:pyruvate kinase [candidate division CSSED10-310 bacterium]